MKPLIDPQTLLSKIKSPEMVLIDARSGADSRAIYQNQHLEGALHVHLEDELSDIKPDPKDGGRHPLPSPKEFGKLLGRLGITAQSHVVVYDDQAGANAAARFWWMLRAAGHKMVQVINGGYQAATNAGFPVSNSISPRQQQPPWQLYQWMLPLASMAMVHKAARDMHSMVIDVRGADRYSGKNEPYDPMPGHIPGAVNIPYYENLDKDGLFLPDEHLEKLYNKSFEKYGTSGIIVHCGSGVTACHTLLAMDQAGFEIPALYVGSFSEWSRMGMPVEGT